MSKKKCWPQAAGQLDGLHEREAEHVGVEVDGPRHVAAHEREVVQASDRRADASGSVMRSPSGRDEHDAAHEALHQLAADALGHEVDVEDGVGADHVDVAVDALQLVVEVVHRRAARREDVAHDVAAAPHDVGDRQPQLLLLEQVET